MPLSAVFILFDFVIHNPTHTETHVNLSLLDITGGHFSLLERASGGSLPTSYIAEFAHIARQYVKDQGIENAQSKQSQGNCTGPTGQQVDENPGFERPSSIQQSGPGRQSDRSELRHDYASEEGNMDILVRLVLLYRSPQSFLVTQLTSRTTEQSQHTRRKRGRRVSYRQNVTYTQFCGLFELPMARQHDSLGSHNLYIT